MKAILKTILILSLVLMLSGVLGIGLAGARFIADDPKPDECSVGFDNSNAIPGTFPVGKCLTAPGQQGISDVGAAQRTDASTSSTGRRNVVDLVLTVINLLVKLIGSVALVVFIIGALLTVTSEGKEDRLEKGKSAMIYAVIGLVVTLLSSLIVSFVQSALF